MKQSKILLISMAVLAMLIMGGCSGGNSAQELTNNETDISQPSPTENADNSDNAVQDNAVQDNLQPPAALNAHNVTIFNTSLENTGISPMTLSLEDAAQIGIQYIMDIFGENVDGMYMDLEFSNWDHIARTLWHGAVSENNRNTLENRARNNELSDIFMARYEAGEDPEDIMADMSDMFLNNSYVPAQFYFFIDANTGERIDIWRSTQVHNHAMDESIALHDYIEQEWGDDWEAAFAVDVDPQEKEMLRHMAMEYAQRHFNNSVIARVDFESASTSFIYAGGRFNRDPFVTFLATNDAGREARVAIHLRSHTVTSITSMGNDFIPMDIEAFDGERVYRREEGNDDQDEREAQEEGDER